MPVAVWCIIILTWGEFVVFRTLLAGLHFNENANRSTAKTKEGVERYKVRFPKYKRGGHVLKKIMTATTYSKSKQGTSKPLV